MQAQQYQQNWHEYQVLTGNSRKRKRSVFSFLSRMFSGILSVKASIVFSFLPILHLFTSMGQLLQDTQNNYDTTNTPFKSTRELDLSGASSAATPFYLYNSKQASICSSTGSFRNCILKMTNINYFMNWTFWTSYAHLNFFTPGMFHSPQILAPFN